MTHFAIDRKQFCSAGNRGIIRLGRVLRQSLAVRDIDRPFDRDRALGYGKRIFHRAVGWLDFHKGGPVDFDHVKRKNHSNRKQKTCPQKDHEKSSEDDAETGTHRERASTGSTDSAPVSLSASTNFSCSPVGQLKSTATFPSLISGVYCLGV